MFLFFGWGCIIWQPLALQYGKRPVYLFSILATLVWTDTSQSDNYILLDWAYNLNRQSRCGLHIAERVVSGMRTRSCRGSLALLSSPFVRSRSRIWSDLTLHSRELADFYKYFTHERGKYMGLYAMFLFSSNILAPVRPPTIIHCYLRYWQSRYSPDSFTTEWVGK